MNRPGFNQNERLAMTLNGLESGGKHFNINEEQAEKLYKNEEINKFNDKVNEYVQKFERHANALDKAAQAFADSEVAEIRPVINNVIIRPFTNNPFQRIKKEGNIIVDLGGQKPTYKNDDTGNWEEEQNVTKQGVVLEVGPECKYLQRGDCVFYPRTSVMPIPFYKQGLELVNENRIIAVVNDNLKERFDK